MMKCLVFLFGLAVLQAAGVELRGGEEALRGFKPVVIRSQDGKEIARFASHHALVIGCSSYRNGWQPLPGVKGDVKAVADLLESQDFAVTSLLDPTKEQLDATLTDFIAEHGQREDARVVIYYAGHGQTARNAQGAEMGYLVPVDAPEPTDRVGFLKRAFPIQTIKIKANELGCRHALFLFDACFSGSLFAPLRGANQYLLDLAAQPVRMFITSGSKDEQVPDESVFRQEFVTGIREGAADANRDGFVTGQELALYLRQQVSGRRAASGGRQTPQAGVSEMEGMSKGDFVFVVPRGAQVPSGAATPVQPPPAAPAPAPQPAPEPAPAPVAAQPQFQPSVPKPAWAAEHGADRFGTWAVVRVKQASQRFRLIQPGTFLQGSPANEEGRRADEAQRTVRLSRGFWLGDTEVTQSLWKAVMKKNPSKTTDNPLRPVDSVNREDIASFCTALGTLLEGAPVRLPTEAEWEYACRAGAATPPDNLDEVAWMQDNSGYATHPVAKKDPNAWGLFDMLGNVQEWTADWYKPYIQRGGETVDPAEPVQQALSDQELVAQGLFGHKKDERPTSYAVRGGSNCSPAKDCRPAKRSTTGPGSRSDEIGLRLLIALP